MKKIALFSASAKTDEMFNFARELVQRGYTLWASGGTYKSLVAKGIDANDISLIIGKPILNHRVVTLSREIFAGILADISKPEELEELEGLIDGVIEVVYVDLYHLGEGIDSEMRKMHQKEEDFLPLREKVDIGGPSLLRAAAKGNRVVVSDTSQVPQVLEFIDLNHPFGSFDDLIFKLELGMQAEIVCAQHCEAASSVYGLMMSQLIERSRG